MKPLLAVACLALLTFPSVAATKAPKTAISKTTMTVALGENSKMTVVPSERERVRQFYRDVLGCRVITKSNDLDLVQFSGHNFYIGIVYDTGALSDVEMLKAAWLDIRTQDPKTLKAKILEFGLKEVPYWDKEHFYFQAPGGQVFRLVASTENMSKWQR